MTLLNSAVSLSDVAREVEVPKNAAGRHEGDSTMEGDNTAGITQMEEEQLEEKFKYSPSSQAGTEEEQTTEAKKGDARKINIK